jgi:hypothetical protein
MRKPSHRRAKIWRRLSRNTGENSRGCAQSRRSAWPWLSCRGDRLGHGQDHRSIDPDGLSGKPVSNRRELDMLVSTGERISMSLMSMALSDLAKRSLISTALVSLAGQFSLDEARQLPRADNPLDKAQCAVRVGDDAFPPRTHPYRILARAEISESLCL